MSSRPVLSTRDRRLEAGARVRRGTFPACALLALAACTHAEPFAITRPDDLGPFAATLPRRLTFSTLGDITPSVVGDTLVFSRVDPGRADRDRCLALLPLEGGRLYRTACARGAVADSVRDAWLYPVISPDRQRVAYVRERYLLRTGSLLSRVVVVASLGAPDSVLVTVPGAYPLPSGNPGNGFRRLSWKDDATLRFLGGTEISGDGAVGGFLSAGVFEVSVAGNGPDTPLLVPELATALAYAVGDDGAVYFTVASDPFAIQRFVPGAPAGDAVRFTDVSAAVLDSVGDFAVAGDAVVALATFVYPEGAVQLALVRRDLAGGPQEVVTLPFAAQRLVGVPGRDLVIAEAAGDLWLVAAR